jgi:hypothetical protein
MKTAKPFFIDSAGRGGGVFGGYDFELSKVKKKTLDILMRFCSVFVFVCMLQQAA